jgi:Homeodomain-like domain
MLNSKLTSATNSQCTKGASIKHFPWDENANKTVSVPKPVFAMTQQTKSALIQSSPPPAVIEYRDYPERPVKIIAAKFGLSPASLILQAREAQIKGRKRGRRRLLQPKSTHLRIIKMYRKSSGHTIAKRLGLSPQRVYNVLKRWDHLFLKPVVRSTSCSAQSLPQTKRDLRDTIVSFRLTAKEIESVKGLLRDLGLSRQLSKGRACRIVFLALLSGYRPATCVGE